MRLQSLVFLFLASILLLNCSKKAVPTTLAPVSNTLDIQQVDFKYLQGKGRINYQDQKGARDVKTTVRIHKDSVIWMAFSVIGVQGGKVLINKDSITILSTLDKEYFVFTYDELSKRFNFKMDYNLIQSALLGNLIEPRSSSDVVKHESSMDVLQQNQGSVYISNYINTASAKLERVELIESSTKNTVSINYKNFQPLDDTLFPYNGIINIFYRTPNSIINNNIVFEYTKIEVVDGDLKFPFTIPRKYERR